MHVRKLTDLQPGIEGARKEIDLSGAYIRMGPHEKRDKVEESTN
jgi:hypothetical protein